MKSQSLYHILPLLFYTWCFAATAQPFVTHIYTANDGLPDAYTLGLYQDKDGYLWIGSYTGLSRFDGQRFVTIETKNNTSSISANVVLQDHLGRLWINYNKTVCILNKDSVISFPAPDGHPMNYVFGAIEFKDHRIWALADHGAYEFTGHDWKQVDFPSPFKGLNCRQVIETEEGLYINFEKYIVLRKKDGAYEILNAKEKDAFNINMQKSGKAIYAVRVNGVFKLENGEARPLFAGQLSQTTCYNFLLDAKERFWISTEKFGILVSDPGNETHLDYSISLPFNLSTFLYEDRDQNVWATNYEGLIKISEVRFQRFDSAAGAEFENIRCLAADANRQVYFASSEHGIYAIVPGDAKPLALSFAGVKNFMNDVVDGIAFDDKKAMWLITRERKLIRYKEPVARELTTLLPKSNYGFHGIVYSPGLKKILLGSDKLYIGDENGFQSWGQYFQTSEIEQPRFLCLLHNGDILVNTIQEGVLRIRHNIDIDNISAQLGIKELSKEVRLYEDPDSGIWVTSTGGGISHFIENENGEFEKAATITTKDGLPNNTVISAVFDHDKKLWMTTLSGIVTLKKNIDVHEQRYIVDRAGEELGNIVLNWGASGLNMACDQDNNIWISTFHELIRFLQDSHTPLKRTPGISIENIKLNLKETDWTRYADSSTGYFRIPFNPILDYSENSLGILYHGISFSESPGLLYSYSLSPVSLDASMDFSNRPWSEPTASTDVSFVKLPPGHYVFAVKAKETGTGWSFPAAFYFTILPPFWRTWWFAICIFLLLVFFIWTWIRFRVNQFRRKADIQRQLNELEMRALKAQMNPHFIYNALNSIQSLVMDGKQQESVKYMSKFARLLRQVLEHSGTNLVTLDKELNTIDLYVQLETLRMNANLDYTVAIDDQILAEKELVPPLILQPFVENALWHGLSRKEGDKQLRIEINADDAWLYFTITDNGIGRQKAEQLKSGNLDYPRSLGMEITGKRLQVVNAQHVDAMTIHDLLDADGHPAGTQVQLKLKRQIQ